MISLLQQDSSSSSSTAAAAASPTRPQQQQQQQQQQEVALPQPPSPPAAAAATSTAAVARGFINRLFTTLNWTLTEFTVAVGELHHLRGQRSILEVQNQYRRTGLMFELSVNFLRLLEFVVVSGGTPGGLGMQLFCMIV
jgi:hypothetical protein